MNDIRFNDRVKALEFNEVIGRVYFGRQEVGTVYGSKLYHNSDEVRTKQFKLMLDGVVVFSGQILVKWLHANTSGYEIFGERIPDSAIQSWKSSGLRWVPEVKGGKTPYEV